MDKKIILHIPHSSTNIPLSEGYLVDFITLEKEILKLTDWYTDDLFYSKDDEMIVAEFSRIFCDPERFPDDSQEVMAQSGMGVLHSFRMPLSFFFENFKKNVLFVFKLCTFHFCDYIRIIA